MRRARARAALVAAALAFAVSLATAAGLWAAAATATADVAAGPRAFAMVARVLQSPRCQNCHPDGDRPLQGETGRVPHRFDISRRSADAGLPCGACHQARNAEDAVGVAGGPPGAPGWGMPPAATPMVFEGRSARALCQQLGDRAATGGRDLAALLHHVSEDPLVRWAWNPGGARSKPPVDHATFVAAFRVWVESGGACP